MFLAHSIRLRDPWQCERTDDGATRWSRTFHKPTGLEVDDDLWLVLSGLPEDAKVTVNGHAFTHPDSAIGTANAEFGRLPARYNVTLILTETNRIEILLSPAFSLPPPASSTFPFDARLAVMARS